MLRTLDTHTQIMDILTTRIAAEMDTTRMYSIHYIKKKRKRELIEAQIIDILTTRIAAAMDTTRMYSIHYIKEKEKERAN